MTKEKIRCAIYTRKSTEEGLEQEFNSLNAQREAAEAYIASQKNEGWLCQPEYYDDGGFTGGNMERPALRRLLSDIEDGRIDCVVVYKVDRLSRSLMDFSRLIEAMDKHSVSFVSVTQQFNTTTSMGRLTLNILLSFAQFEREIISERTRDKIAATRRKGKWTGGRPVLGYDIQNGKLVVNEPEAIMVRAIFELYLKHQSLSVTANELNTRGWTSKRWVTKKGHEAGGKLFVETSLANLLTNVLYGGKVSYKKELHSGEHSAIVGEDLFERVQQVLKRNRRTGGAKVRNKYGALLNGLLHCSCCNCAMSHSHTKKGEGKRYRYYVCLNAQKRGWDNCSSPSVPAPAMEQFVVDQIRAIGQDKALLTETVKESRTQVAQSLKELKQEKRRLVRELARLRKSPKDATFAEQLLETEQRATKVEEQIISLERQLIDAKDVARACSAFDPVWNTLTSTEQSRLIHLLVERVEFDGEAGAVSITFHPTGIKDLATELEEAS